MSTKSLLMEKNNKESVDKYKSRFKDDNHTRYTIFSIIGFLLFYYGLNYCLHDIYSQEEGNIIINKTKLTDSIYVLHGPNANVLVFIGNDGTLLVDTEKTNVSKLINATIKEITDKPIKFIINTHWHSDHTDGNKKLGKEAIIIAHDSVRNRLTSNQYDPFDKTNTPPLPKDSLPLITYSDNMTLYLNNDEIKIIHAPGHTDGDSIVYFIKNNLIYLGDLLEDREYTSINTYSKGNIDSLISSLEKVKSLINNKTIIYGGHFNQVITLEHFNYNVNALKEYNDTINKYITNNRVTSDKLEGYNIIDNKLLNDIKVISENLTTKHSKIINEPNPWYSGYNLTVDIILNRIGDNKTNE